MKNKTTKILLKILILFPIGFLFWSFTNGFDNLNLVVSAILGLMFSSGVIFWNIFDYEKFDEMSIEDFLESTHNLILENTDENWKTIRNILKNQFLNSKMLDLNVNTMKMEIERKFIGSILSARRKPDQIIIRIERKFLKYMPDNAGNYRTLRKISKQIIANTKQLAPNPQ